jgi:hypothetical protein
MKRAEFDGVRLLQPESDGKLPPPAEKNEYAP